MSNVPDARIQAFEKLWPGGYYEGDPLDPMGHSNYNVMGYMSVLHAVYLACIKPYIGPSTNAIEVGAGKGAWSRAILSRNPAGLDCLEAVPAEHSGFWDYVGNREDVRYHQVKDFSVSELEDQSYNYLFSFGCFCHVPREGIEEYLKNLHRKLVPGSHGFIMIGDFEKYNRAIRWLRKFESVRACHGRRYAPVRLLWRFFNRINRADNITTKDESSEKSDEESVSWRNLSISDACEILERNGYRVVDPDMELLHRDPIIHFLRA